MTQFIPHNAMLEWYMLSSGVCRYICPSVTSRHCTEMAKHSITQTMPYDSTGTFYCHCRRSQWNSNGVNPNQDAK